MSKDKSLKGNCRKECKECPWVLNNNHSVKFRKYTEKMKSIGKELQSCHMIESDVWGYSTEISESNICIGFIKSSNMKLK